MVGEFVAHDDSRLRFGSLNHLPGDAINPQRPIAADSNSLISLPLLGAQRTWRALLPALSWSRLTHKRHWLRTAAMVLMPVSAPINVLV
jgi:hypothetical protein